MAIKTRPDFKTELEGSYGYIASVFAGSSWFMSGGECKTVLIAQLELQIATKALLFKYAMMRKALREVVHALK
eukprot:2296499-Amphidinium_carterae.1